MENYETVQVIGTGTFGRVTKVRRKTDHQIFVWKQIYYGNMNQKQKQQLVAQVNILRELNSNPNIVKYVDRIINQRELKIYIIMEFCQGGDMSQVIKQCQRDKEHMPQDVVWKIFTQITLALYECHKRREGKILHRDIKPSNIFLDGNMNVKLGDFGLSRIMSDASVFAYSAVGTPYYMSPEQITNGCYNQKSDIWSLGCLLYEILSLKAPFPADNQYELNRKIRGGVLERLPSIYSQEIARVVFWLLSQDQSQRPSVDDLMNLPQVSLRLRDKRLRENQDVLRKREQEIRKREEALAKLEAENQAKEKELNERESRLIELERRAM